MKKLLLIAIIGWLATFQTSAQNNDKMSIKDKDVPQAVRTAFDKQFDNTMMVNWKMKDGNYKATFTQNLKKHIAEFNSSGELLAKGEKINRDELPTAVADAVKNDYSSSSIDEVYRIERGGTTQYMVKLEGNGKNKIVYDEHGKVVKEK